MNKIRNILRNVLSILFAQNQNQKLTQIRIKYIYAKKKKILKEFWSSYAVFFYFIFDFIDIRPFFIFYSFFFQISSQNFQYIEN